MNSIRTRLLLMLLSGITLVLAIGGYAINAVAQREFMQRVDAELQSRAEGLIRLVAVEQGDLEFEFDHWPSEAQPSGYFEIRDREGRVVRSSYALGTQTLDMPEPDSRPPVFADVELPGNIAGRAIWLTFEPREDADWDDDDEDADFSPDDVDESDQILLVAVAIDRTSVDQALAGLRLAILATAAAVGAVAVLFIFVGVSWGLRPIDRLCRQIAGIGDRQTAAPHSVSNAASLSDRSAPLELQPVYRELQAMLDRIDRTIQRERSFADATAHELRTPLAELRAVTEVATRWPDTDRMRAALEEAQEIGVELEQLVESLLTFSRGTSSNGQTTLESTQLAPVVASILDLHRPILESRRIKLCLEIESDARMPANRAVVELVARNLIDNAVQYTCDGGEVRIASGANNGTIRFAVANGPVELQPADVPRLFEPFWRHDASHGDRTHVGLGLTVVQRVAEAAGFRLDAFLHERQLTVRVQSNRSPDHKPRHHESETARAPITRDFTPDSSVPVT